MPVLRAARRLHQSDDVAADFDGFWAPLVVRPSGFELGSDLGGKIGRRPLDPLAQREAGEGGDPDRLAGRFGRSLDNLADPAFAVDHEDLLQEHDLLIEFAQPALDHALDDRLGLAAALGLLAQYRALAVERRRRHRGDIEIERVCRRDMHRQLAAEGGKRLAGRIRFERHQDADLAEAGGQGVVHVRSDLPLPDGKPLDPAQYQVLADPPDQLGELGGDGAAGAGVGHLFQRLDITIAADRERGDGAHESLEQLVASDEIGLRIDFDHRSGSAARRDADEPFGGDPAGLFRGGREALLAQPVDGRLDIAAAVAERALAVHHPGAGLVAQFLDQRRRHLGHRNILSYDLVRRYFAAVVDSASGSAASASSGTASRAASSPSDSSSSGTTSAASSARAPTSMPEAASSACSPSRTAPEASSQYK